jgi:2,5-diketo-D-gluconate reductase A
VHVDSAEAYRNEAAVGRALARFGPGRAFLASKLSDRAHLSYDGAKARVAETLRLFGVETVDLYSLHSAFNFLHDAKARADLAGAWRALVELQKKGTLRALGVSNFNAVELRAFAEDPALGGIWVPDALQNKVDVYRRGEQEPGEDDVLAAAKELDIAVVAYSSLSGWPRGVGARADPLLRQLAARRGVDVPTLILRWHVDAGHAAIPRSRDAGHVAENLDALSRAREPLAPAERAAIDAIPHLVAGPRNRPATADAFRVRGGARPEL